MLQAGISPVRIPDEVDFLNLPKPFSPTMTLGSTLTSTRSLPGSKKWPARRADKLAANYGRMSENVGASTSRNRMRLHGLYRDKFIFLPGAISQGVKRPGREANHSPASSAEFKNGATMPLPHTSWHSASLIKHRDNFT
jgi:hypothetical protein